ncbi:unnamed protein product, partial [Mesorhabditis spiculigera]
MHQFLIAMLLLISLAAAMPFPGYGGGGMNGGNMGGMYGGGGQYGTLHFARIKDLLCGGMGPGMMGGPGPGIGGPMMG